MVLVLVVVGGTGISICLGAALFDPGSVSLRAREIDESDDRILFNFNKKKPKPGFDPDWEAASPRFSQLNSMSPYCPPSWVSYAGPRLFNHVSTMPCNLVEALKPKPSECGFHAECMKQSVLTCQRPFPRYIVGGGILLTIVGRGLLASDCALGHGRTFLAASF